MSPFDIVLLGGGWMLGWVLAARPAWLRSDALPAGTRVSVVIPARNEEASLPALLDALAMAQPAPYEIVVVDDGSTDGTAREAAARGATVVATDPPPGWTGKSWACWRGAETATGDVLVFLDADTVPSPPAVGAVAAAAARTGGLVSVQPWHRTERPSEQLSAMANLVAVLGAGTGGPPRPCWWRAPMAFGPCIAVPAAVYARFGGHAAIRASVADDVALARRADRNGTPVTALLGGHLLTYRMYPDGLRSLVEGWTKNLASGAGAVPTVRMVACVAWIGAALRAATLVVSATGSGRPAAVLAALVAYGAFAFQAHRLLRRLGSFTAAAVAYPVALVVFMMLFVRSVVATRLRRQVRWRGRTIAIGRQP